MSDARKTTAPPSSTQISQKIKNTHPQQQGEYETNQLDALLRQLRQQTGIDFSHFKLNTLQRRIQRRIGLKHLDSLHAYTKEIHSDLTEAKQLASDLLISVTSFFRDAKVWKLLEQEVIPTIIKQADEKNPLRIWVPACATGEEAYSYGISFSRTMRRIGSTHKLQIYATDIDDEAREFARQGIYPTSIRKNVSAEILEEYFDSIDEQHYRVKKSLREMIVFAHQDIIYDPPFSKLDLVSCRNMLIYFDSETQNRIFPLLHFALKRDGYLILGNAENIGNQLELFNTVSKQCRIFQRIGASRILEANYRRSRIQAPQQVEVNLPEAEAYEEQARRLLTKHLSVAGVFVNKQLQVMYTRGLVERYLNYAEGVPTNHLISLCPATLKAKLRKGLRTAFNENKDVVLRNITLTNQDCNRLVRITINRTSFGAITDAAFIIFEDEASAPISSSTAATAEENDNIADNDLEEQLCMIRHELQGTIEELETSNEELKASNEEVISINEELQSSNEELETSKEELHLLNQELSTLNNQLEVKSQELAYTNNDLQNLLTSSEIASIFLDSQLRIKRFTRKSAELFNLSDADVGRLLSDLSTHFADSSLLKESQQVLQKLDISEREIKGNEDRWFFRRILPYRTQTNEIRGVVITFFDVTDLKEAQFQAKESEYSWRRLLEDTEMLVALFEGPEHRYTFTNRRHREFSSRVQLNRPLQEAFPELVGQEILDKFDEVFASGHAYHNPEYHVSMDKDGNGEQKDYYFNLMLQPWYNSNGSVRGIMSLVSETTDVVRAQRKASEHLRLFEVTGESIPYGVWWCNAQGTFQYVSESFLEMTGLTLAELQNDNWLKLLPEQDREPTRAAWKAAMEAKVHWEREHRIRSKDGGQRLVLSIGRPVFNASNKIEAWVGLNLDMTERREYEVARQDTATRLDLALRASCLGTHRYTVQSGTIDLDEQSRSIFGLSPNQRFDLESFRSRIHPDDLAEVDASLARASDPDLRETYQAEYRIHPFDGSSERIIAANGIFDFEDQESGKPHAISLVGTIKDVTERRLHAQEMLIAKEAAEAANRTKTAFLANMSHDIRTPLTAISGYAEIVAQQLDAENAELADEMKNACGHLLRTLNSVLKFARMEGKAIELDLTDIDLSQECRRAYDLFLPIARAKGVKLKFNKQVHSVHVYADLAALNRILSNLLDNAIKFTPEDRYVEITVFSTQQRGGLRVEDQGRGMAKNFLGQLFNPFSQEREKHDTTLGGSGLGMAIAKQLVDSMGGNIKADSEEGNGTTIEVQLPLAKDSRPTDHPFKLEAKQSPKEQPAPKVMETGASSNQTRILACDDYPNTRRILGLTLRDYPLDLAADESELFEKLDGQDVILLDINLQGRNVGSELLKRIRKDSKNSAARIIAFTAHCLPGQGQEFIDEGFDGYLPKPFTRDELLSVIREAEPNK
ncbi:CheR family methyltransferase [Coraliomargarita sp. SDUM461004]|uniref:histidine kinase n=2 Tax=Thalassobacterium sedimentorum TaxID=3041258 RepID=A0ABU1AMQ0_9BACT|nr:CheR family methyltransferase [Coraliomargarita sp. SDUM461004]